MLRLKLIQTRGFAIHKPQSATTYLREGSQPLVAPTAIRTVSKAASGVTLATHDHLGPTSSLAIYIKAGSRFEHSSAPGVAHLLHRSVIRVFSLSNHCLHIATCRTLRVTILFVSCVTLNSVATRCTLPSLASTCALRRNSYAAICTYRCIKGI